MSVPSRIATAVGAVALVLLLSACIAPEPAARCAHAESRRGRCRRRTPRSHCSSSPGSSPRPMRHHRRCSTWEPRRLGCRPPLGAGLLDLGRGNPRRVRRHRLQPVSGLLGRCRGRRAHRRSHGSAGHLHRGGGPVRARPGLRQGVRRRGDRIRIPRRVLGHGRGLQRLPVRRAEGVTSPTTRSG